MAGMDRRTGARLDGLAHIEQSVADILSTAVGSTAGLRDYGSLLPDLVDQPHTPASALRLYAATAVAITRWERRIRLRRVGLSIGNRPGAATITLDADRIDTAASNSRIRLTVPLPL